MKLFKGCLYVVCASMVIWLGFANIANAYSPLYDTVLETLEQLPRDGGIVVDFGVEEGRYEETFKVTDTALQTLREAQVPQAVLDALTPLSGQTFASQEDFTRAVEQAIGKDYLTQYEWLILNSAYDGGAMFNFGDKFEARFRADTDCYVALIHIAGLIQDRASGEMSGGHILVLLPNQNQPNVRIKAGQVYSTIRDFSIDLTAGPPAGFEVVNIMCSTEPFDLFQNTGTFTQGYAVIAPTDEAGLQHFLNGLEKLRKSKMGGTGLVLRVHGGERGVLRKKFGAIKPMGGTGTTGKFFPGLEQP